ncbi:MAG: 4-hydroxy-tetrahydrodipicolinate synthase [Candidatus Wallbacteria bacterium HGW-Wallbacteria-1]|jgi:4-hydroxy-tetrahydrodipicolinate synthase|uniref:4-hydroxy-tetrahydrodipicolinate synthase n=1 Tax=Candidatus Wallbacteria bacterium HGW-Wallbacteria-1 TaxID=2013854 RepID=A0A2N1PST0_9BACT|nr:MAG: 4-hydroxy-tetrahydrodipicolinate synthase [Candidatus Wallbacteria bacterium HGW-Wallbacteria-1]
MLSGTFAAITTPFAGGALDKASLFAHALFLKDGGINGLFACGTTGEGATVEEVESLEVLNTLREALGDDFPIYMGTGSNSTSKTLKHSRKMADAGADGLLVVTPYYNKPTQEGLYRHFAEIAQSAGAPVFIYNVTGRTAVDIKASTVARLARIDGIIGIKEANADHRKILELRRDTSAEFSILSGDDYTVVPTIACGGNGVISVVANIIPALFSEMVDRALAGDFAEASRIQGNLIPLVDAMFIETNPIPVKEALSAMGFMTNEFRLPLCSMDESGRTRLLGVMNQFGLPVAGESDSQAVSKANNIGAVKQDG